MWVRRGPLGSAAEASASTDQRNKLDGASTTDPDARVMKMGDGTGIFGDFPEAQTFSSAYEQTKQDLAAIRAAFEQG